MNSKINKIFQFLASENIEPKDKNLYVQAFTHSSYRRFGTKDTIQDYQTFEFLGDSILQFLVSNHIFRKELVESAGNMTLLRSNMVNTKNLNALSRQLDFHKMIIAADGNMGREVTESPKVGADVFESFVAALFLDQGLKVTNNFLIKYLFPTANEFVKKTTMKDSKTELQEYMQSYTKNAIKYVTVAIENGLFEAKVYHDENIYGVGQGENKLAAEEEAAKNALSKLIQIRENIEND
ncbi:ribonuclease III [Mycoplasmopsis columbinasalis]|uniref:Ribonuclease 3 n=1 Tax=Mycoplasmopsis columbinasalis TaxID=114880 RepID=A0A449BA70_9BACT|nr:ribonuclease III [Mycoplasmopsis columbinasalis]VEU78068.1 Ribonuclease III [Mycoplasmopsis columbinasalis]